MARGFESKSVADQQEAAQQARRPRDNDGGDLDPAVRARRRRLELARTDVMRRMASAQAKGHKEMLRRALSAIEKDIAALD